jgi:flavin-dependent dehydrogenase
MMKLAKSVEAAVIGGGPAGAAAALLLARNGVSTLLLDASNRNSQRIGETLPPVANRLLLNLGLWNAFRQQHHHASEGIVAAWTDAKPQVNDFFVFAQGPGWNLDRNRFDAMVLQECENAGASVCEAAKLLSCSRTASRRWLLEFVHCGHRYRTTARQLVDGSGKLGAPPLRCLSPRLVVDRLIGVANFFPRPGTSSYTIIEALEDGWFYAAQLPGSRAAVMYFTDADIYSAGRSRDPQHWSTQLQKTRHVRDWLGNAAIPHELTIVSAATTRRVQFSGDGWIAVGDAAQSFDPLSSLGIYKALDSAAHACDFFVNSAKGDRGGEGYANWSEEVFGNYSRQRAELYRMQRRWPESKFWNRRRTA